MALWLFRRRSRRKWSRSGSPVSPISPPLRSLTAPEVSAFAAPSLRHRQSLSRKQRPEPNKLRRRVRGRTYSFESGRPDALNVANVSTAAAIIQPPTGDMALDRAPTLHHTTTAKRDGQHLLPRTRSSKRRKNAHDRERAAEIKAFSNPNNPNNHDATSPFAPLRPAAESGSAGRPLRWEPPSDGSLPDMTTSSDSDDGGAFTISPFAALAPKPTIRYAPQPRVAPPSAGSLPKRLASQRRVLSKRIPDATLKAHKRVDDLADDMDAGDLRELMERDKRRRERNRLREEERAEQRLARLAERQRRLDAQDASAGAGEDLAAGRPGSRSSVHLARGVLGREATGLGIDTTTSAVVTSSTRRQSPPQGIPTPRDSFEERQTEGRPDGPPTENDGTVDTSNDAEMTVDNVTETQSGNSSQDMGASSSRRASPVEMFHRPDSIPMEPADVELPTESPERTAAQDVTQHRTNTTAVPVRTDSTIRKLIKLRKRLSKSSSRSGGSFDRSKTAVVTRQVSDDGTPRGRLSWGTLGLLFRWRARVKRSSGQSTPVASSFSNISRGSIMAQTPSKQPHRNPQPFASQVVQAYQASQMSYVSQASQASQRPSAAPDAAGIGHPLQATSTIPKRAMSRFREDLPEYLISPPASRSATPDTESRPQTQKHTLYEQYEQPENTDQKHELPQAAWPTVNRSRSLLFADEEDGYERDRDNDSIMLTPVFRLQQQTAEDAPSSYDGSTSMDNSASNGTRETPTPWLLMDGTEPSPEPQQSLSLASIDSEGSWLSGRATGHRRLAQPQRSLDSVSRSYEQQPEPSRLQSTPIAAMPLLGSAPDDEDMAGMLADDEYLMRYAHNSTSTDVRLGQNRESTGVTRPSSDEGMGMHGDDTEDVDMEDSQDGNSDSTGRDGARWGTVSKAQVAAVVVPGGRVSRLVKSREGLLRTFFDGEEDGKVGEGGMGGPEDSPTSPISPISQTSSQFEAEKAEGVQRATSVNLGRSHVRHISAGSAKLLNISPRNSVDAKAQFREPLI